MEEYKIIKDFDNYEISNFGNVKNSITGKILKPRIDSSSYYKIDLYKDSKRFTKRIHKLVATTFLPNPFQKLCVDHIDNNRLNNNVENLRYATIQENGMNRKLSIKNTSGFKGVHFDKKSKKWRSQIKINGKTQHLGYFEKIEDAVNTRVRKAEELYGEYKNSCEKEINININIPSNAKIKLNINIKTEANKDIEELEIEQLEKELYEIINRK
jgi:hypothetical protein